MSTANDNCKGIFGKWFGHSYQANYSLGPAPDFDNIKGSVNGAIRFIEACRTRTYVCSICSRCGAVAGEGMKD